jgi:hypothetical protein
MIVLSLIDLPRTFCWSHRLKVLYDPLLLIFEVQNAVSDMLQVITTLGRVFKYQFLLQS